MSRLVTWKSPRWEGAGLRAFVPRTRSSGLHALLIVLASCASAEGAPLADAGADGTGPRVQFELADGPIAFGSIPFPDDLYRDAEGVIVIGPRAGLGGQPLSAEMLADMGSLGGFSPTAPVFFYIDGPIDPATLPATPESSLGADASVFLLDIDPSSPGAYSRIPVECRWVELERRLAVRPAHGEPLAGGRKYALVVTTRVRAPDGMAIRPSEMYEAVLNADGVPSDPLQARAYAAHINALSALENVGVSRSELAALAVFTVQSVTAGLDPVVAQADLFTLAPLAIGHVATGDELTAMLGTPVPVSDGVDGIGGVAHDNIGWLLQGTASVPGLLARNAGDVGRFEIDGTGALLTKRVESLPFTLCLPVIDPLAVDTVLPLVIFQHGIGRDRSDVLPLANLLNAAGYAVLAIDAPYHGLRQPTAVDLSHHFGDQQTPDGFADGDRAASVPFFLGAVNAGGDRARLHPAYLRDALRQNVSDWLVLLRTLTQQASPLAQVSGLPPVAFATDRIGFVGIDTGAHIGAMLSTADARVDVAVLALTGGGLAEWLLDSPALSSVAADLLSELGIGPADVSHGADPPLDWPAFALWQSIVDAGDALAFAPDLRRKSRDLLMLMAPDDEWASNRTTESLARALRVPIAGPATARYVTLETIETPVVQNAMIAGELSTQALFEHAGATHSLLTHGQGELRFQSSTPPFVARPQPVAVDNPINSALTQLVFFFESWRNGSATVIDPSAQLRVPAP